MRSSFNVWEAKNLIGGQKYVVVMSILKHVKWRALQSRNLRSFFLYLFLNPKLSTISRTPFLVKKSPKLLCQILKNRSAYRWRNTVRLPKYNGHDEYIYIIALKKMNGKKNLGSEKDNFLFIFDLRFINFLFISAVHPPWYLFLWQQMYHI